MIWPATAFRAEVKTLEELYATIARDGSAEAYLPRLQTRANLYDALHYYEYEALDSSLIASTAADTDLRRGSGAGRAAGPTIISGESMRLLRVFIRCTAAVVALGAALAASAETYPTRPVRLIAGFAAGGGVDIGARIFAASMSELWGQQMIVDNRTGAGGVLATEIVAHAAPDGYTLLACTLSNVISPLLYKKLNFDSVKDFAPISATATLPNILVSAPSRASIRSARLSPMPRPIPAS